MSKMEQRLPALTTRAERLEIATSVIDQVINDDGRIEKSDLVQAIQERIENLPVNEEVIEREARKSIAEQLASAWANHATIKLDRKLRAPVYQITLGFEGSFFKVGGTFVQPESMTAQDFEVMLERIDRRVDGAQTDRAILSEFYDRARPGLEAGQNLIEQFNSGVLELHGLNGSPALEAGEENPDEETEA